MAPRVPEPDELADDIRELKDLISSSTADTRRAIESLSERIERVYVPREVFELRMKAAESRTEDLEESSRWMRRAIVTNAILPILVTVVAAILVAGLL